MRLQDHTAIRVFKALADPTRFRILRSIAERDEISCQELTSLFSISQATVSHHLKVLTEAGLVSARKQGPFHYYRAHHEAIAEHARHLAETFVAPGRARRAPGEGAEEGPAAQGSRETGAGVSRPAAARSRRRT
jgi:ArsR family transcriptional regulator